MSKTYETTNRKLRAAQKRQDALECERKGYPVMAKLNYEEAAFLEPVSYEDEELER